MVVDGEMEGGVAPEVSVVVPHFRDFARLDRCLAGLAAQRFAGTYEIVVADNASPEGLDHARAIVAGRARVVVQPDPGAGPARNAGAAAARGRVLAFTDADCLPDPGWLAAGVGTVAPGVLVGGRVEVLSAGPVMSPTEAFEAVFAFDNATYVRAKGFTVTANLFVTAADFARVGPFPTGVSEDIEWCWRARDAGLRLTYAAGAVVGHPARRDMAELTAKWRRLSHELFLLDRGRGRSTAWILGRAWLMLLEVPLSLARLARTPILGSGRERWGAAAVLVRIRGYRFAAAHREALQANGRSTSRSTAR